MNIKGKGLAIAGSIISIIFSLLLVFGGIFVRTIFRSRTYHSIMTDGTMINNPNMTRQQASSLAMQSSGFNFLSNLLLSGAIIFLIIGVVALVLSIKVNSNNKNMVSITLIVIAFIHIIFGRWLSSILLLVAGIMILSSNEQLIKDTEPQVDASDTDSEAIEYHI